MAVAMPAVERFFFFRVDGRLSLGGVLEDFEGIGRLEAETPSLLEAEEGAAVGIFDCDSAAALAAVLVFRGGITSLYVLPKSLSAVNICFNVLILFKLSEKLAY